MYHVLNYGSVIRCSKQNHYALFKFDKGFPTLPSVFKTSKAPKDEETFTSWTPNGAALTRVLMFSSVVAAVPFMFIYSPNIFEF